MNEDLNKKYYYEVVDYREREEDGFYLIFLSETGQCFSTNETGKFILDILSGGQSIEHAVSKIQQEYNPNGTDLLVKIENFIASLERYSIIHKQNNSNDYSESKKFVDPAITPLENVYSKGKQCLTFGMPKRSCKSLSSGLVSQKNLSRYK